MTKSKNNKEQSKMISLAANKDFTMLLLLFKELEGERRQVFLDFLLK